MYERTLLLVVQPVIGQWDEDGNLIGKRVEGAFECYYPFGKSIDELLLDKEKDLLRQAREGMKRPG
jgi:hypothetical protein